nr:MAG TPA: hypothetical protein [Caudoviricetes sp.]
MSCHDGGNVRGASLSSPLVTPGAVGVIAIPRNNQ